MLLNNGKKMNKSVLGTVLGAAILGLAKNSGSKSRKLPFFVDPFEYSSEIQYYIDQTNLDSGFEASFPSTWFTDKFIKATKKTFPTFWRKDVNEYIDSNKNIILLGPLYEKIYQTIMDLNQSKRFDRTLSPFLKESPFTKEFQEWWKEHNEQPSVFELRKDMDHFDVIVQSQLGESLASGDNDFLSSGKVPTKQEMMAMFSKFMTDRAIEQASMDTSNYMLSEEEYQDVIRRINSMKEFIPGIFSDDFLSWMWQQKGKQSDRPNSKTMVQRKITEIVENQDDHYHITTAKKGALSPTPTPHFFSIDWNYDTLLRLKDGSIAPSYTGFRMLHTLSKVRDDIPKQIFSVAFVKWCMSNGIGEMRDK